MNDDSANEQRPLFLTGWEGVVFELEDAEELDQGLGLSVLSTAAIAP